MDPVTVTAWTTAIAAALRLAQQEWRWHRSVERERKREAKRRKKLIKKARAADYEAARKRAGLTDEGGGSKVGHDARKEWDELQGKRKP